MSDPVTAAPWVIWWTNQEDAERAHALVKECGAELPEYIDAQLCGRMGRDGRGRLWVASAFAVTEVAWDASSPVCQMASHAAGVVILESDAPVVAPLPGFITTSTMLPWRPAPASS